MVNTIVNKRPTLTPKALVHQKFGKNACYKIEEVQESAENICPGLSIQQNGKCLYKCHLELPDLSVTSDVFSRKKDAEQSAAKIAMEKLGIQSTVGDLTPEDVWTELVGRIHFIFTDEFLLSSHPLIAHFRNAFERKGERHGFIPLSVITAFDLKTSNLCKFTNPEAESDTFLMMLLVIKAAKLHPIIIPDGELWLRKKNMYSKETIDSLIDRHQGSTEFPQLETVHIPSSTEKPIGTLALNLSHSHYYLDEIASKLGLSDSSRVLISRPIGKSSSEIRLHFSASVLSPFPLDSSPEMYLNERDNGNGSMKRNLNQRASYLSGQNIYGDAILAAVGYTRRSPDLFHEHVSLSTYYRLLVSKVPVGMYKLSREALLVAEIPKTYTTRSNWRGSYPKDLLSMFCRHYQLSEPVFDLNEIPEVFMQKPTHLGENVECENADVGDDIEKSADRLVLFGCEVKILSRQQDIIVQYRSEDTFRKQTDVIQHAALSVLSWLNRYFEHPDIPTDSCFASAKMDGIYVNTEIFSKEFGWLSSSHCSPKSICCRSYSPASSNSADQMNKKKKKAEMISLHTGCPDSGVTPSQGSLVCTSYTVALVDEDRGLNEIIESKDEFEFEIGTGAVINQLEACVTQMSTNETVKFVADLPSRDLILAAAGESAKHLSDISLCGCVLEYLVKLLRVTEPLEDRMEQALFKPPLSKQRVEFAVRFINGCHAKTLVDFGCGSGSLLDSVLDHKTTLEKIVGVDISRKALIHAAKILHSKLSTHADSLDGTCISSALLYDGSITVFDSRIHGFDIGTCLEVIEHMEEDQATLFGDVVLSLFCPRLLIVSTPNYEYNPILKRNSLSSKEDDPGDTSPCKFRNHDHKFEWTRKQFECWASDLASRHNYSVEFSGVGGSGDAEPGFASQIAIFRQNTIFEEERLKRNGEPSQPYDVIFEWKNASLLQA